MRSVATNAVTAIQRLFLTRQGRKDGKGMMLGSVGGAAMKLQSLHHTLHICEGLETGLGIIAQDRGGAAWALGSTSNIQSFGVNTSVRELHIWADHDNAGQKAATTCKQRWVAAGKKVECWWAKQDGWDEADVWSARNGKL
jgi:hypothetical protein